MDYFDLFDLPISLRIDLSLLKKKYYLLSKSHHPDHFSQEKPDMVEDAMKMSEKINTAYKALSDEHQRLKYVLQQYKMLDNQEHVVMPSSFLLEMMEMNESLNDAFHAKDANSIAEISKTIENLQSSLNSEASKWIDDFENQSNIEFALDNLKFYYLKSNYLLRIRENISTFAVS